MFHIYLHGSFSAPEGAAHGGPRTFVTPLFIEKKLLIHNKKITLHSPPPMPVRCYSTVTLQENPFIFLIDPLTPTILLLILSSFLPLISL